MRTPRHPQQATEDIEDVEVAVPEHQSKTSGQHRPRFLQHEAGAQTFLNLSVHLILRFPCHVPRNVRMIRAKHPNDAHQALRSEEEDRRDGLQDREGYLLAAQEFRNVDRRFARLG